jgi:serine protease Do
MKSVTSLLKFGGGVVCGFTCWALFSPVIFGLAGNMDPPELDVDKTPMPRALKLATSFAPVVKEVAPSVVSIQVLQKQTSGTSLLEDGRGLDPFWRFFAPENPLAPRREQAPERRPQGVGSGVIVSKNGFVLTNYHVVKDAETITVVLNDGASKYEAQILGADKHSDIAVLKVDSDDALDPITLADSSLLEVGDVVLAVGSPFGLSQTVTMGIVSGTGRNQLGMMDIENFIQTDASINPGNSGGALVDALGRLIGINTLIMSRSGGNQGVGFAIPVNMVRSVMDQIVQHGDVQRGLLGISMQEMDDVMARQFGMQTKRGVLVSEVNPGGPASNGGVQPGDVILRFNDTEVTSRTHLKLQVVETRPGTEVDIGIFRNGDSIDLKIEIGALPEDGYAALMPGRMSPGISTERDNLEGMSVTDLTPSQRKVFGVRPGVSGVLITEVDQSSNAFSEGLRAGQVILRINQETVRSAGDVLEIMRAFDGDSLLLHVWTQGGARFVVLPLDP